MSSPDTNIDKQVRRHRGPLYGMVIVAAAVVIGFVTLLGWTAEEGNTPGEDTPDVTVSEE